MTRTARQHSMEMMPILSNLVQRKPESAGLWRGYLDNLLAGHGGQLCFTTFGPDHGFDFSTLLNQFERTGDGGLRVTAANGAELWTVATQNVTLTLPDLPRSGNYVFHLLAHFPSKVENNFYLSFENEAEKESVRFGNTYISICDDASTLECDTSVVRLYTFAVEEGFVSLYVNGVLQKRKSRKIRQSFTRFVIRLVGERTADLGASINGIEIWVLQKPFIGFTSGSRDLAIHCLEELIDAGDSEAIHEWVDSYDDIDFSAFSDRILNLLESNLRGPGVKEWIHEGILRRVAPEIRQTWLSNFAAKMPTPVVTVEDLSVRFHRLPNKRLSLGTLLGLRKIHTFDVLSRINFRVYAGDVLGIIGANGAGKSTLLRALAGLLPILAGRITLNGRHLLLAPGLGIREELSGKENIYLASCFMGLTLSQVDGMYSEIVEFSELQEFIDQPFKFYSDGMKSRLIFSIATSVAPDVLMLDELLNAGDIKFQVKAAQRLDDLISRAKIVIVVTHNIRFVLDKCSKALLLSRGRQIYYGNPRAAVSHYFNELHMSPSISKSKANGSVLRAP